MSADISCEISGQPDQSGAVRDNPYLHLGEPENASPPEPYSPKYVAHLLHESFRISQGVITTQPFIMEYLADRFPDRFTAENLGNAREIAAESAAKFALTAKVHDAETAALETIGVGEDPQDAVDARHKEWEEVHQGSRSELDPITEILHVSVAADYAWLAERGGRPRADQDRDNKPRRSSKWLSQTLFYGLARHPYGIPEYDELFQDVTSAITNHWDDSVVVNYKGRPGGATEIPLSEALTTAANIHLTHYPDDWNRLAPEWQARFKRPDTAES
jgi:hypothetical protein